ncbi:hypothetical protein L2E82_05139 [Cichorium intybus]|uniref:Uncharacterized protein n=1 Tax=Cichorium intybus TaxID=13427 RepID=A0ACB9H7U0_CICIN|nr:hypothetical protein L2E82_05139 [Cichorium intybus]
MGEYFRDNGMDFVYPVPLAAKGYWAFLPIVMPHEKHSNSERKTRRLDLESTSSVLRCSVALSAFTSKGFITSGRASLFWDPMPRGAYSRPGLHSPKPQNRHLAEVGLGYRAVSAVGGDKGRASCSRSRATASTIN